MNLKHMHRLYAGQPANLSVAITRKNCCRLTLAKARERVAAASEGSDISFPLLR